MYSSEQEEPWPKPKRLMVSRQSAADGGTPPQRARGLTNQNLAPQTNRAASDENTDKDEPRFVRSALLRKLARWGALTNRGVRNKRGN